MEFPSDFKIQDDLVRCPRGEESTALFELTLFGFLAGNSLEVRNSVQARKLDFYCLVHVYQGSAWLWTEAAGRAVISEGEAVLLWPGMAFDFAAASRGAAVDRICFNGGFGDQLKEDGLLPPGVCSVGSARRLLPVIRYAKEVTRVGGLRARSGLLHLLTELEIERQSSVENEVPSRIRALMDAIRLHPEMWRDSEQMAKFCHLSEAQLRRVFKKETGLSPKLFQDTVRAQKAEELLKSGFSVNVVSDLLGYSDPFHFSRRFKALIGKTPRDCLSLNSVGKS